MERVEIALAADADYFPGLLVTVVTMARSAAQSARLRFNILDGGLEEANRQLLEVKTAAAHPAVEFRYFTIDDSRFAAFPTWSGNGRMAYARLLLSSVLADTDMVIYCDVDFLWTADVAELWNLRDSSKVLQAQRDPGAGELLKDEATWFSDHGIAINMGDYVCTGLMIINLCRWRQEGLERRLLDFLSEHRDVHFVDQTAINAVVRDVAILPDKWGVFSRNLRPADLQLPLAIHFSGLSPWSRGRWTKVIGDVEDGWFDCYAEIIGASPFAVKRRLLGIGNYLKRRTAYRLVAWPGVRQLTFIGLRLLGRGVYVPFFKALCPAKS